MPATMLGVRESARELDVWPKTGAIRLFRCNPRTSVVLKFSQMGYWGCRFISKSIGSRILRDCGLSATVRRLRLRDGAQSLDRAAMPNWMRRTALGDLLGTDFDALEEDPLYEVLDKLHPHRATIEAALS